MARSYMLGNQITLSVTFLASSTRQPASPTTVTCSVQDPSGTVTTYTTTTSPGITSPGTGMYQIIITPALPGYWTYRWAGSGAVVAVAEAKFEISPSAFAP